MKVVLWLMFIGMVVASLAGVIVPYLPTAGDDIATMTQDLPVAEPTQPTIDPNSVLNQFQDTANVPLSWSQTWS